MHLATHIRMGRRRRRAGVTVQVALALTFIVGFAALSIDVGTMHVADNELQRAADASCMAAAQRLTDVLNPEMERLARADAETAAQLNTVLSTHAGVAFESDLAFGRSVLNPSTGKFEFSRGTQPYDAVEVTLRRERGTPGGPINLQFARLFGHRTKDLQARATAMLVPRDVAVVVDLSGSMSYDSQLRYWNRSDGGYANTRDVWAALDGPECQRPYHPGREGDTEYSGDSGPTFGVMTAWGDPLIPGAYSAATDPGLYYIKYGTTTSDSRLVASLTARGYTSSERTVLLSGSSDGSGTTTQFRGRAAVLLGLATWKSGKTGSTVGPPGTPGTNGNNTIDSSELVWAPYPSFRQGTSWTWSDFIDWSGTRPNTKADHPYRSGNEAPEFRYRYGLKTLVDFLIEDRPAFAKNNNLWQTPEQPLRAVKDGVQVLTDVLTAQDSLDHLSLEIFATTGRHEINLTSNLQSISDLLYQRQSGHYDSSTSIGGGLDRAINELQSSRSRPNASKMIVLLSDGMPNVSSGGMNGSQHALAKAQEAADRGIRIFTISVGYDSDRPLMQQIAAIGSGQEYFSGGNPDEYTDNLRAIFSLLGGKKRVSLIE